jgi:hypothetical protein
MDCPGAPPPEHAEKTGKRDLTMERIKAEVNPLISLRRECQKDKNAGLMANSQLVTAIQGGRGGGMEVKKGGHFIVIGP